MSQVTMYSTTWCGYCRRLKLQMDRAGIDFREVDIERDQDAARFVEGVNGGNQTVPVVRFPDRARPPTPPSRRCRPGWPRSARRAGPVWFTHTACGSRTLPAMCVSHAGCA